MIKNKLKAGLIAVCAMSMAASFSAFAQESGVNNYFVIEENYDWLGNYLTELRGDLGIRSYYLGEPFTDPFPAIGVDVTMELVHEMNDWQRRCAPYASVDPEYIPEFYNQNLHTDYYIKQEEMIDESNYVKAWLDENMKSIVPVGTSSKDAVKICYDWIQDNIQYNARKYTDGTDTFSWKVMSGLQTGGLCCSGYSSLLKDMVNYLVFDENNNVVYLENGEQPSASYKKLNMYVVTGNGHAWNAMKDIDGTAWYYFDITFDDKDDGSKNYDYFAKTADEFYNNETISSNKVEYNSSNWVRGMYLSDVEYWNVKTNDISRLR